MSYIEKEAVLKIIDDNCPHDKGGYNTEEEMGAGAACYYIRKDVDNIPTADVVEVVRCKDCIWWSEEGVDPILNRRDGCCSRPFGEYYECDCNFYTADNDFCSYGERRTEE